MALYLIKDLDDDYHSRVGVWQITESEEELKALASVPSDELEEISYIKNESLRKQKLAVRCLLDALFEEKVYLSHHDNGKPYIENSAMNISITHTNRYVAVILNPTDEVGIDCESLDRDFSAVKKKALSEDEIEEVEEIDEEQRNEQLAIYWCAKEAVYKMMSQYGVDFTTSACAAKANWSPPSRTRTASKRSTNSSTSPSTATSSSGWSADDSWKHRRYCRTSSSSSFMGA